MSWCAGLLSNGDELCSLYPAMTSFIRIGDCDWAPCADKLCKFWIHGDHYHVPSGVDPDRPVQVLTKHTSEQQEAMRLATLEHQAAMLKRMNELAIRYPVVSGNLASGKGVWVRDKSRVHTNWRSDPYSKK